MEGLEAEVVVGGKRVWMPWWARLAEAMVLCQVVRMIPEDMSKE